MGPETTCINRCSSFSPRMAEAGYLTLRFNFLYKEQGKKAPDSPEKLYQAWEGAYRFLSEHPVQRSTS